MRIVLAVYRYQKRNNPTVGFNDYESGSAKAHNKPPYNLLVRFRVQPQR